MTEPHKKVTIELPFYMALHTLDFLRKNKNDFEDFLKGREAVEYADESADLVEMEFDAAITDASSLFKRVIHHLRETGG